MKKITEDEFWALMAREQTQEKLDQDPEARERYPWTRSFVKEWFPISDHEDLNAIIVMLFLGRTWEWYLSAIKGDTKPRRQVFHTVELQGH